MRYLSLMVLVLCGSLGSTVDAVEVWDWDAWRELPVQNGGRHKPLDTVGREMLRAIANRSHITDPQSGAKLDPTALYLTLLFDWQGWDHPQRDQLQLVVDWRSLYTYLHPADKWDAAPLLRVDFLELRRALRLVEGQKYVAPAFLEKAQIEAPGMDHRIPFSAWANKLLERDQAKGELSELEQKGLELADRWWTYQNHRMGRGIEVLPIPGNDDYQWMPLAGLLLTPFDDATDPSGELRQIQQAFSQARTAFQTGDAPRFHKATHQLISGLRELSGPAPGYPSVQVMQLEVAYNRWVPFRIAWMLMLLAAIGMSLHLGTRWKSLFIGAFVAYIGAMIVTVLGFGLRIAISGRPPVTNMYESVVYVGAGVALFGLIFEVTYRRKYVLAAAATVTTVTLILADNCPLILDPSVRPLEPVLRSNFWLVTHVMTITLSYAALALALGIANITLGYYLVGSNNRAVISSLSRFTYKAIQVGVLLLAIGVVLGGVWADYSWGRFWGWDPKEVWALVALLGYLAVLHARFAGWVSHRGLAALAVGCFSLVIMAWYGVNFVLGAGLHSYGFGGGGQSYVFSAIAIQFLYAAAAVFRPEPIRTQASSALAVSRQSDETCPAAIAPT